MVRYHSKTKVMDVKEDMGWDEQQWERFKTATNEIVENLYNDDYWTDIPRPKPFLWTKIPLAVREKILEEVNSELLNDHITANLDVLQYRLQPILLRKSSKVTARPATLASTNVSDTAEKIPSSEPANPPVAKPHPHPAKSPEADPPTAANQPEPTHSRPPGFWDPVAEAMK